MERFEENDALMIIKENTGLNQINECNVEFDASGKLRCADLDKKMDNSNARCEVEWQQDEDKGLVGNYASSAINQRQLKGELIAEQRTLNWLLDDFHKVNMTSTVRNNKNETTSNDSLDDFAYEDETMTLRREQEKNEVAAGGDKKSEIRNSSNKIGWLSIETEQKEQLAMKDDDIFAEGNWKKKIRDKERKRGQNLTDAAAELKKLAEHDL